MVQEGEIDAEPTPSGDFPTMVTPGAGKVVATPRELDPVRINKTGEGKRGVLQ